MFIDIVGSLPTTSAPFDPSGTLLLPNKGMVPPPSQSSLHTSSFWIWFYLTTFCNILCLGLNAVFSTVSVIERHRTFNSSFHAIVLVFSISVVVSSTSELVHTFVAGLVGLHSQAFNSFSITVDLATSYFSALLIFFLGLNRFAAFSSPYLFDRIMRREVLYYALLGLLMFSIVTMVLVYKIGGLQRTFAHGALIDYASNCEIVQVSSYVFYMLPPISSVFYLLVYKSLRSKRGSAVSGATKSLLSKAERCNLKTGLCILITYLISLIVHVVTQFPSVDATSLIVLSSLGTITSAAPEFALPLAVFICSKEARDATSHIWLSSVKSGMFSLFSKRKMSSASSTVSSTISNSTQSK